MTWFLLALVLVFLVVIGVLSAVLLRTRQGLVQGRRQIAAAEEQARDAEQRSVSADDRVRDATEGTDRERKRADQAEYQAAQAEGRLALSRQQERQGSGGGAASQQARQESDGGTTSQPARQDSAGGTTSQPARQDSADGVASLEALWSLALLEQERAWRLTMATPAAAGAGGPRRLAEVLDTEISRIREEAGTPGRLHSELAEEPPPAVAVVALRAVEAMLGAITRYSDAYDLYLSTADQELDAVLVCENFDGPDAVADDASAVYRAVAPVGGSLDIGHDKQDRLEARLRVPLRTAPA
jgi:hypothetical protein